MEFKYGKISEKRCREIDEMDIRCPYDGGVTQFKPRETHFVYNEDESILFCLGFWVIPAEMYYCDDVYILFIGRDYYYIYIYYVKEIETRVKDNYYHSLKEIVLNDDLEEKKEKYILSLLKQIIPIYQKAFKDNVTYKVDLLYNGEEVK